MVKRFFCPLVLALGFLPPGVAQQADPQQADIVRVPISALHPTQAFIAHDQVNYTLQRYRIDQQKLFDDLCENRGQGDDAIFTAQSNPKDANSYRCRASDRIGTRPQEMKTAVRGPGNQLYLTDGHHTFSIFQDVDALGPDTEVAVVVTHDRSDLTEAAFWQWLQDSNLTWLYDANGQPIDQTQIPADFGRGTLADDPYRTAIYFLRDLVWERPQPALPFAEFYWAQHIRSQPHLQVPALNSSVTYLRWLERISGHMLALPADTAIGPDGQGPDAMGRMALTEVKDIVELLCDDGEPGRLALALAARGIAAGCADLGHHSEQAVLMDDPLYADTHTLADLNQQFPGITSIIETWFRNYKGASGNVTGLQWQEWP